MQIRPLAIAGVQPVFQQASVGRTQSAAAAAGRSRKDGKPEAVIAKISQESLAEMIGTTRSRISFFMNKFASWGSSSTIAAPSASTARCSTSSSTTDRQVARAGFAVRVAGTNFFKK
jgi:hypothetical protein